MVAITPTAKGVLYISFYPKKGNEPITKAILADTKEGAIKKLRDYVAELEAENTPVETLETR